MIAFIIVILIISLLIFFFYASYSIELGFYLKSICRIKTTEKVVFLTFDDGPSPERTERVLNVLDKYHATACFFCIGEQIQKYPQIAKQIVQKGHLIGNHSYSHSSKFPIFSFKRMVADLTKCDEQLDLISLNRKKLFRPPFGVTNPTIAKAVRQRNYISIGWCIRTFDTMNTNFDKILHKVDRSLKPGAIILLHDRVEDSEVLLERLLCLLVEKGYSFNKPIL